MLTSLPTWKRWFPSCFTLLVSATVSLNTFAQNTSLEWAYHFGGASADTATDIDTDTSNNVFTVGYFQGSFDADPGVGVTTLTSAGGNDLFVMKQASNGDLMWAYAFGSTGDDRAHAVRTDEAGNCYLVGRFEGTVDFDPGAGTSNLTETSATASWNAAVYLKLDASGNLVWAKTIQGDDLYAHDIAVDNSGNIGVVGGFSGTVDFNPNGGITNLTSTGGTDYYASKLSSAGNIIWNLRSGSPNDDAATAVDTDPSGNFYITGYYEGTADLDPGVATNNVNGINGRDIFGMRLSSNGGFSWGFGLGTVGEDEGAAVAVSAAGDPYFASFHQGSLDADPSSGSTIIGGTFFQKSTLIQKFDDGGNFIWAQGIGVNSAFLDHIPSGIAIDPSGAPSICGYFGGTVDFDPGTGTTNLTASGDKDAYVLRLDDSGNFFDVMSFSGTGLEIANSIDLDLDNHIRVAGAFAGTVDFDPTSSTNNLTANSGSTDFFVVALDGCPPFSDTISVTACDSFVSPSGNATYTSSGTYIDTITGPFGCDTIRTINLALGPNFTALSAATVQDPNCSGVDDGIAVVTASGTATPFSYSWSDGQTGDTAFNLGAGVLTVTVTDANGCSASESTTLTYTTTVTVSFSSTVASCNSCADGSITATGQNGTAPYTYLWSSTATTSTLSNVLPGTYTVTVTDANGCTAVDAGTVGTLVGPLAGSVTVDDTVSCNGGSDGALTAVGTDGVPPYTYLWSHNSATTQSVTGLSSGTYTVTITDSNSDMVTASATLSQPSAIGISTTLSSFPGLTNVGCNGGTDGSIDVTASGGTPGYSYSWTGPNSFSSSSQNISGLAAGTYTVTVTDANGCTATQTETLIEPSQGFASATSPTFAGGSNVSCVGASDGSIDLTVGGGTSPRTYQWSGPNAFSATTQDLSNLEAGTYTVTVTDFHGCITNATITLTSPTAIVPSLTPSSNISCNGGSDGGISTSVSGGVGTLTYSWTSSNAFSSTDQNPTGLQAGTYTVVVTDSNGCTGTDSISLNEPSVITVSLSAVDVSCPGANDGQLSLAVTGGTPGYTYNWSGPNGFIATTGTINSLEGGLYSYTVTDANSCTSTGSQMLSEPTAINLNPTVLTFAGGDNISCNGLQDGSINLAPTGGTSPYSYTWTGPSSFTSSAQNISSLDDGTYLITVTDTNGCTSDSIFILTEPTAISQTLSATTVASGDNISCFGGADGSVDLTVSGGSPGYIYNWTGPSSFSSLMEDLSGIGAGTYVLLITDTNGCTQTDSITLTEPSAQSISLTPSTYNGGTNISCPGAADGTLTAAITGGAGGSTFDWTGPNSFTGTGMMISSLEAGLYQVTATDINGCTATDNSTLTEAAALTSTATSPTVNGGTNISCFGGDDGSVDLTATGGTPGYTYSWTGPGGFTSSLQNIDSLTAGNYQWTVTDTNGCTDQGSILVLEPSNFVANGAPWVFQGGFNISCNGAQDGQITLFTFGGTAPFNAVWSGPNGYSNSGTFLDSLFAGTYSVIVTDANGCIVHDSTEVIQPDSLKVTLSASNISCPGDSNGSITANVTGGVMPYNYSWNTGASGATITGLTPDSYSVAVSDTNGCADQASVTLITAGSFPVIDLGPDTTVTSANPYVLDPGAGFATYTWQDNSSNQTFSVTQSGVYSVTVTEGNGCAGSDSVNVTVLPVGIGEQDLSESIRVFPNPTRYQLNVSWDASGTHRGQMRLLNNLGQVVLQEAFAFSGPNPLQLDLSSLSSGLYFLSIDSGEQRAVFRVEKQ